MLMQTEGNFYPQGTGKVGRILQSNKVFKFMWMKKTQTKPNRNPKQNPAPLSVDEWSTEAEEPQTVAQSSAQGIPWLREYHVDKSGWLWPVVLLRVEAESRLSFKASGSTTVTMSLLKSVSLEKANYVSCWEHRKRHSWGVLLSFLSRNYLFLISFMPSLNDHSIHHALFVSKDHEKQTEMS